MYVYKHVVGVGTCIYYLIGVAKIILQNFQLLSAALNVVQMPVLLATVWYSIILMVVAVPTMMMLLSLANMLIMMKGMTVVTVAVLPLIVVVYLWEE